MAETQASPDPVTVIWDDQGVAVVTMSRGPVNAADAVLHRELTRTLRDIQLDARAIVLTGAGDRAFCAGNDLNEFAAMNSITADEHMRLARETFWTILDCSAPVIGAINGVAVGTGMALASCCDFVVASDRAKFALPELTAGVLGGVKFGARMLPEQAVRRMFLLSETLTAREMVARGAPLDVVPPDQVLPRAIELAVRIAAHSPVAVRFAKEAMRFVEPMDLRAGYLLEQRYTVRLADHPDSKEAVAALLERRAPNYGK